ncbi:MAG: outer membrane protein assembly factor BamD [Deltaproteobacteria bacterium]|nr:outer membrane protein assembly factor BamD [Deltaproteobacteria bacterium]
MFDFWDGIRPLRHFFLCLMLAGLLQGCGLIDYVFLTPPEDTAQEMAEAGRLAMQEKRYGDAIDSFTKLKERYPFSPYTAMAELALGDAYFLDEQYKAAVATYKEFEALHPRHEAIPYVLFQIGKSNFLMFDSIDLPQDNITEAVDYFNRVALSFPDSPYAGEAREYIVKCRRYEAEHEVFVADFYWRTGNYEAAWQRYSYVVDRYPEQEEIVRYSLVRRDLSYFKYQKSRSQERIDEEKGSWKQWFDWL